MALGSNRASNGRKQNLLTKLAMHRVAFGWTMAEAVAERESLRRKKVCEIQAAYELALAH